jgi:regulator of sigma E protease
MYGGGYLFEKTNVSELENEDQEKLELESYVSLDPVPIGGDEGASWPGWLRAIQSTQSETAVRFEVARGEENLDVELIPQRDVNSFYPERGFRFVIDTGELRAESFSEALSWGAWETRYWMMAVFRFLDRLISGDVSWKMLGGPGTIAYAAGASAKEGPATLLIFLTLLSANLAVVNFLPIPVLDGGHMVFLLMEAVFRRPVSEKIVIPLTYAGLALILCLMAVVIGLDVDRFFFGG